MAARAAIALLVLAVAGADVRSHARDTDGSPFMAQAGLPDADSFLKAVRENLGRAQQLAHHYAYKERRVELHLNPFGRMGMGDTRVAEVFPDPNPRLTRRRVIERNGKPVSAAELAQQDAEYRERVEDVRRRLAREDNEDRVSRERDEALARQRAQMMITDVVNTLQFQVVGREMRHGVPTVVVTFAARPGARPVTREGRTARVFKGTVWIHEVAREVMDVEAVAIDDISYGGFIAKLYEGTEATLVRREIDPGVWMPIRIRLEGEARALFRRTKIDFVVEWFDYRRMSNSKSQNQIPNPNRNPKTTSQIANQIPFIHSSGLVIRIWDLALGFGAWDLTRG